MAVCSSVQCKKYKDCAKASINNEGIHTARCYHGATVFDMETQQTIYLCGELGNYAGFKPLRRNKNVD